MKSAEEHFGGSIWVSRNGHGEEIGKEWCDSLKILKVMANTQGE